jgi:hypothetical protein
MNAGLDARDGRQDNRHGHTTPTAASGGLQTMGSDVERLGTAGDFERCIEESAGRPVVILKHSTT